MLWLPFRVAEAHRQEVEELRRRSSPAKPVCGNGVLENGEQCDSGEGCAGNCRCDAGYQTIRSVDCEQLPHCGDGIAGENEACDGADLKEQSCAKLKYAKGDLSCTPDCNFDIEGCVTYEELYIELRMQKLRRPLRN